MSRVAAASSATPAATHLPLTHVAASREWAAMRSAPPILEARCNRVAHATKFLSLKQSLVAKVSTRNLRLLTQFGCASLSISCLQVRRLPPHQPSCSRCSSSYHGNSSIPSVWLPKFLIFQLLSFRCPLFFHSASPSVFSSSTNFKCSVTPIQIRERSSLVTAQVLPQHLFHLVLFV
jgi:hypothetical protein